MHIYERFVKIHLGIKVTVEDGVDILQDVTQFLQLPLHPSLHDIMLHVQAVCPANADQ